MDIWEPTLLGERQDFAEVCSAPGRPALCKKMTLSQFPSSLVFSPTIQYNIYRACLLTLYQVPHTTVKRKQLQLS